MERLEKGRPISVLRKYLKRCFWQDFNKNFRKTKYYHGNNFVFKRHHPVSYESGWHVIRNKHLRTVAYLDIPKEFDSEMWKKDMDL